MPEEAAVATVELPPAPLLGEVVFTTESLPPAATLPSTPTEGVCELPPGLPLPPPSADPGTADPLPSCA